MTIKVWVKIVRRDKIIKDVVFDTGDDRISFFDLVRCCCEAIGQPTPIILDKHYNDFRDFNVCFFKPDDFIDAPHFDRLSLERI